MSMFHNSLVTRVLRISRIENYDRCYCKTKSKITHFSQESVIKEIQIKYNVFLYHLGMNTSVSFEKARKDLHKITKTWTLYQSHQLRLGCGGGVKTVYDFSHQSQFYFNSWLILLTLSSNAVIKMNKKMISIALM